MSPSNYPPGVSGLEYQIAGPDHEVEAQRYCEHCAEVTDGLLQSYGAEMWFICEVCDETTGIDQIEPDPDRGRDELLERGWLG